MEQLLLDLAQPPAPTFSNFAPGRNRESLVAAQGWVDGRLRERCVYLWGPPGCGRTHLLRAAVGAAGVRGQAAHYAATEAQLLEAQVPAAAPAWLAVDDIDLLRAPGQGALFSLLNEAANAHVRLLLAGDTAPTLLDIRADTRTRVAAGLVFQLHPLTDEETILVLQAHAHERGFDLPAEGASHLLQRARRDLPSLMAILDAADDYSLRAKRPVTLALLRQVLDEADTVPRPS